MLLNIAPIFLAFPLEDAVTNVVIFPFTIVLLLIDCFDNYLLAQ